MNPFFSPLYLELPQPRVRSICDTSLQCFFVERRDAGSVSPNTASQEESDQICLFHIWKRCTFQGESGETPSSTCGRDNCFWFPELCSDTTPRGPLPPVQRGSGHLNCELVALQ